MRSKTRVMMAATLAWGIVTASTTHAQTTKMLAPQAPLPGAAQGAYYSPSLKAHFQLVVHSIPTFPQPFWCMRIVSSPQPDSPLIPAGLGVGDFLVRLDGVHVADYGELERHVSQTTIRYIRPYGTSPETVATFINNPYYPQIAVPPPPYYPNSHGMGAYPNAYYPPTAPAPYAAPASRRPGG